MKLYINELSKDRLETAESVLFNGNGNIGLRNNLTEEYYNFFNSNRETYINGFYEETKVKYPEPAFGFTPKNETMVSVIDSQTLHIYIDQKKVNFENYEIENHVRYLDMNKGISKRSYICVDNDGNKTKIEQTRLVSFINKQIYFDNYQFTKLNHNLQIDLVNDINFKPQKSIDFDDPRMSHEILGVSINKINLKEKQINFGTENSDLNAIFKFDYNLTPDKYEINDENVCVYFKNIENDFLKTNGYFKENEQAMLDVSYEQMISEQEIFMDKFWEQTKVHIDDEQDVEMSINYGNYALLQSTGQAISAKGLSGSGYEGHYFWDGEMYVLPLFIHTNPEIAREMIKYRIDMLPKAIKNREMVGYKSGALFPWRTISGDECSAFFEAGMAQHHINADICYGLIQYIENTGDYDILNEGGIDLLEQTSEFYKSICYLRDGKYHIDKVTGPDEYSVLVDDNYYTNMMVRYQFEKLVEYSKTINYCLENEIEYKTIAKNMYYKVNEQLQVVEQDRDYLNKQRWPYDEPEKHPLLIHYHPLEIYRYQISKQADVVLALMLHPNNVSEEVYRNTVNYYDEVTTHDSSLSFSAYSTCYSRLGETDKAYNYFLKNARLDIDNIHGNTKDGIHTASMGGSYMTILYGFLGFEVLNDKISISPNLPKQVKEIMMPISFRGERYKLYANHKTFSVSKVERN